MKISMHGLSVIGDREYQQDCFYINKFHDGAAVCDGMGGLDNGEIASRCAIKLMAELLDSPHININNIRQSLYDKALDINNHIKNLKNINGDKIESGTTVVAIKMFGNSLFWLSVGDSKIYLIRKGKINSLTREHNYKLKLDELMKSGYINEGEYRDEAKKSGVLISFLGINKLELIDINANPLMVEKDDIIILCSDGLYKILSEKQILAIVEENYFDAKYCAEELIRMTEHLKRKKQDNTTIVVVKCE